MCQNRGKKFNKILEDNMAKDTKYLSQIRGTWHFNFTVPTRLTKWFKQKRIRYSLNTSDYKQARFIRDKYLMPVVTAQNLVELMENFSQFIDIAEIDLDKKINGLSFFLDRMTEKQELSLFQLGEAFLKQYKKGGFSDASVRKISSAVNSICGILGKNISAENITKKDIIRFRDILLHLPVGWQKKLLKGDAYDLTPAKDDEKSMHPNTVKKQIEVAYRIFAWGINDCKLERKDNPVHDVKIIRAGRMTHKRPPEGNEVEQLCNLPMPRSKHFDQHAWDMLPIFARYTACRIGEIALLTVKDVVVKDDVLCLKITAHGDEKRLKNQSSERLTPVSKKLKPFLDKILTKHSNGPLFPHCGHWYDNKGQIRKPAHYFLKAYSKAAKKIADDLSIHCWRVYANTQMANAGVDILDREAVLGHKSDRVQRVYTAENMERLQKAVNTIF